MGTLLTIMAAIALLPLVLLAAFALLVLPWVLLGHVAIECVDWWQGRRDRRADEGWLLACQKNNEALDTAFCDAKFERHFNPPSSK